MTGYLLLQRSVMGEHALHVATSFADAEASLQRKFGFRDGVSGGLEGGNGCPDAGPGLPEGAQRLGIDSGL